MDLIVENTLGNLRCVFSRKYENTEKSYAWSGFSKIGSQLVG